MNEAGIPGLLEGTGKPDSARCVDISTKSALAFPNKGAGPCGII